MAGEPVAQPQAAARPARKGRTSQNPIVRGRWRQCRRERRVPTRQLRLVPTGTPQCHGPRHKTALAGGVQGRALSPGRDCLTTRHGSPRPVRSGHMPRTMQLKLTNTHSPSVTCRLSRRRTAARPLAAAALPPPESARRMRRRSSISLSRIAVRAARVHPSPPAHSRTGRNLSAATIFRGLSWRPYRRAAAEPGGAPSALRP